MYFPHGFLSRFQYDLMSVMDDPVAYGVRQGGVSYDVVPGVDGELGRYDGGARPIPVVSTTPFTLITSGIMPSLI
jgi:hypothetical protein